MDLYRLLVYPVLLGKGKRIFQKGAISTLNLPESQSFSSGVVVLVHKPGRK